MKAYEKLLDNNKAWATQKTATDPTFFSKLVDIQKPDFYGLVAAIAVYLQTK